MLKLEIKLDLKILTRLGARAGTVDGTRTRVILELQTQLYIELQL